METNRYEIQDMRFSLRKLYLLALFFLNLTLVFLKSILSNVSNLTMIQRIQTVYLLLVTIACIAYIFVPAGQIKTPVGGLENWIMLHDLPIMIEDIVVAAIAFISIFLFNNRKNQMKMVLGNIFLSVVLIGLFIFGLTQYVGIHNYIFKVGAILPVFILLFNILAYFSIKSDEKLVRSMDRLR